MRIIAKETLRDFWRRHPDAEASLRTWYRNARKANWRNSAEIKRQYGSTSIIDHSSATFNIKNDYRLVTEIDYTYGVIYVCFVRIHAQYNAVDARKAPHGRY